MTNQVLLSVTAVLLALSTASAAEKSQLTFTQDRNDLIVSMRIAVNNSSHVLWTHSSDHGDHVTLHYFVFQNRDLLVRSQKQVEVTWRLANTKQAGKEFRVLKDFLPDSVELQALLPQLRELADEGLKRRLE